MAKTREIEPEAGSRCWSCGTDGYPLPDGMPDRTEGVIVFREGQEVVVEIQGRRWRVLWWQLDCGREYETVSGRWTREPDIAVKRFVERSLRDYETMRAGRAEAKDNGAGPALWIDRCKWILARNKWG